MFPVKSFSVELLFYQHFYVISKRNIKHVQLYHALFAEFSGLDQLCLIFLLLAIYFVSDCL